MSLGYLLRRVVVFFLVMWAAMTLIFFLPKLAPGRDPIQDRMAMLAATGGANSANIADMVKAYQSNFGLDQPLYVQYFRYLGNIVRLESCLRRLWAWWRGDPKQAALFRELSALTVELKRGEHEAARRRLDRAVQRIDVRVGV